MPWQKAAIVGEQRMGQISPTPVLQVMVKPSPYLYHEGLRENDFSTCDLSVGAWQQG